MQLPKPSNSTGDFVVLEPGLYTLVFDRFDGPKNSAFLDKDNKPKQVIDLIFKVVDDEPDINGTEIKRPCGWSMHKTKSVLYPMVCALAGHAIADDEDVNLEDYIDVRVQGTIVNVSKPSTSNPGEMATFHNLQSISPMRRRSAQPARELVAAAPAPARTARRQASTDDLAGTAFADDEE